MKKAQELEGDDLLEALGVKAEESEAGGYTPQQQRILAGFEDILRFHERHGHAPRHGQHLDIFERLYAIRLDRIRKLPEQNLALLHALDRFGLLAAPARAERQAEALSDEELLAALSEGADSDISTLVYVRPPEARREMDTLAPVAERVKCEDFDLYKPLFEAAQAELAAGQRVARPFEKDARIERGDFFLLDGQIVYVAAVGETFRTANADVQGRLRAIYSNGTESNILLRSLQRALYEEHRNGRRITKPDFGPLFGDSLEEGDVASGTIYVLESLSTQPEIAALKGNLYKIGVTGGCVKDRIAHAKGDPTYLYAPVKIVAEYKLMNVNRVKLEKLIHRIFSAAQLHVALPGYPGYPVQPREWFTIPLTAIDEAIRRIQDGSITEFMYEPHLATLKRC